MKDVIVIGLDPGMTSGIGMLALSRSTRDNPPKVMTADVCQTTPSLLLPILDGITDSAWAVGQMDIVLAMERFVYGPRSGRLSNSHAAIVTRELIEEVSEWARKINILVVMRSAADVKPWATDARLAKVGILDRGKGMPHGTDGLRHALYEACHNQSLPDPFSRKASPVMS